MSNETCRLKIPEPHFTLFKATRQDLPEVVVVNDALLGFREIEIFPWHLLVRIEAQEVGDNGMPSRAESDVLLDLCDQIEATLQEATTERGAPNVVFLARSTWNERCELDFYVHDPEIAHPALQTLIKDPHRPRPWEYSMNHDPAWDQAAPIFRLFPLARGLNG